MTSIQILDAYQSLDGADLHVACNYCWTWHLYGTGGAVAEVEYRVAHCWVATSPYFGKGYSMRVVGQWDLARAQTRPWVGDPLAVKPRRRGTRSVDEARPGLAKVVVRAEPVAQPAAPLEAGWDEPVAQSMIQITREPLRHGHEEQPINVLIDAARSRGDTVALRDHLALYEQHARRSFQAWARLDLQPTASNSEGTNSNV